MSIKQALSFLFGRVNNSGIHLDIKVKGFDVGLNTGEREGEYKVTVRSNGQNPGFPKENSAKVISFIKSDSQFNLCIPQCISAAHDYSRIVLDVIPAAVQHEKNFSFRLLNSSTPALCLLAYIRDEKGEERMFGGMNIETLLPPREISMFCHQDKKSREPASI